MSDYIRANHPSAEQHDYNDDIAAEKLPGCGDIVVLDAEDAPPAEEGDVFRGQCPSCKRRDARLEVVETVGEA